MMDSSIGNFVKGLFVDQDCRIGFNNSLQTHFRVTEVQIINAPIFANTMRFECLSPIIVSSHREDGSTAYLSPEDPRFGAALIRNLSNKLLAVTSHAGTQPPEFGQMSNQEFRLLNSPRQKGIKIKEKSAQETKVIGYLFNFELTASPDLHEVGYFGGFGEKNSMGFGCVQLKA
jgi:CRISPR-associated endoribonuclease Cas6